MMTRGSLSCGMGSGRATLVARLAGWVRSARPSTDACPLSLHLCGQVVQPRYLQNTDRFWACATA